MATRTAVGSMSDWSGVLKDFFRQIHDGSHTLESVIAFNEHRDPFAESDVSTLIQTWHSFYLTHFNLDVDFSSVRIPERRSDFTRLILIPQGLTPNKVVEAYRKLGIPIWLYIEDLDSALDWTKEERDPHNGSYAILVRDRQEADEELKGLSANDIQTRNTTTETLTERLVHEAKFFSETGQHLDVSNVTLAAGSRGQDGLVPLVDWHRVYGRVRVGWCLPDNSSSVLRARVAVP